MTYDEIIAFFGKPSTAAERLGVSRPALSAWKNRGAIPAGRQALIQIQTKNKLMADKPEMVPKGYIKSEQERIDSVPELKTIKGGK